MAQASKARWAVLDCGKYPSDKNCKLKIMAPEDQIEDLLTAGKQHAIHGHGHADSPELTDALRGLVEYQDAGA